MEQKSQYITKFDITKVRSKLSSKITRNRENNPYSRNHEDQLHYPLIEPFEDETFQSWIIRQSWALGKSLKEYLLSEIEYWNHYRIDQMSLISQYKEYPINIQILRFIKYCNFLPLSNDLVEIYMLRGIDNSKALQYDNMMNLKDLENTKRNPKILTFKYHLIFRTNIVFCPQCLLDKKYLRKVWLNPFYVICKFHGCKLIQYCNHCSKLVFSMKFNDPFKIDLENFQSCPNCKSQYKSLQGFDQPDVLNIQNQVIENIENENWQSASQNIIFGVITSEENKRRLNEYLELVTKLSSNHERNSISSGKIDYYTEIKKLDNNLALGRSKSGDTKTKRQIHSKPGKWNCKSCNLTLHDVKIWSSHRYYVHTKKTLSWKRCETHDLTFSNFLKFYQHKEMFH